VPASRAARSAAPDVDREQHDEQTAATSSTKTPMLLMRDIRRTP
jgi:hypothetical protein